MPFFKTSDNTPSCSSLWQQMPPQHMPKETINGPHFQPVFQGRAASLPASQKGYTTKKPQ